MRNRDRDQLVRRLEREVARYVEDALAYQPVDDVLRGLASSLKESGIDGALDALREAWSEAARRGHQANAWRMKALAAHEEVDRLKERLRQPASG